MPAEIQTRKGLQVVDLDDHMRPDTTIDTLSRLRPAFKKDGHRRQRPRHRRRGAALILASREAIDRRGLQPIGRLVGWAVIGVEPSLMGMGPAPAVRSVLETTGLSLEDIDLIEVNEAFAGLQASIWRSKRSSASTVTA